MDPAEMDHVELERLVDRELRRLPRPRAPRTLLPRVLAAAAQPAAKPAVATGWFTWPRSWQAASVAAAVALVAGLAWLLSAPPPRVTEMAQTAGETATLMRVLWDVLLQPAATYLFAVGIGLTLVGAAAWAALEFALGGASHQ